MEFLIILAVIIWVAVSRVKKMQTEEQRRKAAAARSAFERRAAGAQEAYPMQEPARRETLWGTLPYDPPAHSDEGGTADGDPFCQGPAGLATSTEGYGGGEGFGSETAYGEGLAYADEGGKARLHRVNFPRETKTAEAQPAPKPTFVWDRNAAVKGILYAEILGKPKALRR